MFKDHYTPDILFEGALPRRMLHQAGHSEVYGLNSDIDSTALMVNITSWDPHQEFKRRG